MRGFSDLPIIDPSAVPELLYHGTNMGEAIRGSSILPSKANAGSRGLSNLIWFSAKEETAANYCFADPMDGPHGWGSPEILVYRYIGGKPLLDLRGLERPDIVKFLGPKKLTEVIAEAGCGGILTHSTTFREGDEWGFVSAGDLEYVTAKEPSEAWFIRKRGGDAG